MNNNPKPEASKRTSKTYTHLRLVPANMFDNTTTSGYGGLAPPPQALVEDVQITFDTDMMDEDEALAFEQQQQPPQQNISDPGLMANGVTIGFDVGGNMEMGMGMDTDTVQVATEKVHLRGVDTMATGDIEAWARKWTGEEGGLVRVQWIDDSSCKQVTVVSTEWRERDRERERPVWVQEFWGEWLRVSGERGK